MSCPGLYFRALRKYHTEIRVKVGLKKGYDFNGKSKNEDTENNTVMIPNVANEQQTDKYY